MRNKKKGFLIFAVIAVMLVASACSKNNNGSSESSPAASSPSETAQASESASASPAENTDPLGKYDPPIELTGVSVQDGSLKIPEGDSMENNVWTRAYEEELGIKIKNLWTVTGDAGAYDQKLNVSIAANDLPDVFQVNTNQLKQLIEADALADLSDAYEKYASPLLKDYMTQEGTQALDAATFGGKLMAIPASGGTTDGATQLWVRTDWLKKLNLSEPKTIDDVVKIADAFTNQDPDGNGKKDTIGFQLQKELYERNSGYAGIDGFMFGYHAYPRFWLKDASGQLVNGSILPETKAALAKLAEMYKAGLIDREFGAKDSNKAAENQAAGKNGLAYGHMWNSLFPYNQNKDNDPTAEWKAFAIVSPDGQPAMPGVTQSVNSYNVVKKGVEHPEAFIKMLNLYVEKGYSESSTAEIFQKFFTGNGFESFKFAKIRMSPPRKNLTVHLKVKDAVASGDTSKLNPEEKTTYDFVQKHLSGQGTTADWAQNVIFGPDGSQGVINNYVTNNLYKYNEFYGAPTESMGQRQASLEKMEYEVFTKIIMGASPIDAFDKFVEDWKKAGGDQITKEVNEWYASKK